MGEQMIIEGKPIDTLWRAYMSVMPRPLPPKTILYAMKVAFYGGAMGLFRVINAVSDDAEQGVALLRAIDKNLDDFEKETLQMDRELHDAHKHHHTSN